MPMEIRKIMKKYGNYAGVLKNGTSEEKSMVSNYIGSAIQEMQENNICD